MQRVLLARCGIKLPRHEQRARLSCASYCGLSSVYAHSRPQSDGSTRLATYNLQWRSSPVRMTLDQPGQSTNANGSQFPMALTRCELSLAVVKGLFSRRLNRSVLTGCICITLSEAYTRRSYSTQAATEDDKPSPMTNDGYQYYLSSPEF